MKCLVKIRKSGKYPPPLTIMTWRAVVGGYVALKNDYESLGSTDRVGILLECFKIDRQHWNDFYQNRNHDNIFT